MRKLLLALLVLALLAVIALVWAGRRAGGLPEWYREARAAGTLESDLVAAGKRAEQGLIGRFGRELLDEVTADDGTPDESFIRRIQRRGKIVLEGLREGREVRLAERDLEEILLAWAADSHNGRRVLAATRAVRAEIDGGEIELGAVLVPSRLPDDLLTAPHRRLLDRLLSLSGAEDELYLGLRSVPAAAEGRLVLAPPLKAMIGELELGLGLLARLGLDVPELTTGLPIDVGNVQVRSAAVDGDVLVLVVSPQI